MGELIAQLYLLAHGVQAAPPIRDSGNDLIACLAGRFCALQVKTRKKHSFSRRGLPEIYDGVVLVVLQEDDYRFGATKPDIYLLRRDEFEAAETLGKRSLEQFRLCPDRAVALFG
jgi:hypothetical protein